MKEDWIKFSESDIQHILDLIRMNEDEGTYINGRIRWQKKNKRIKTLLTTNKMKEIKLRVRLKNGDLVNLTAKIPNNTRNDDDAINGAICDWLDSNEIDYSWYRILD